MKWLVVAIAAAVPEDVVVGDDNIVIIMDVVVPVIAVALLLLWLWLWLLGFP
jgi:hypothetical protein